MGLAMDLMEKLKKLVEESDQREAAGEVPPAAPAPPPEDPGPTVQEQYAEHYGVDLSPYRVAYAYSPSETATTSSRDHLMARHPIDAGRLHRRTGEALCRRDFWGLQEVGDEYSERGWNLCPRCLEIARRLKGKTP